MNRLSDSNTAQMPCASSAFTMSSRKPLKFLISFPFMYCGLTVPMADAKVSSYTRETSWRQSRSEPVPDEIRAHEAPVRVPGTSLGDGVGVGAGTGVPATGVGVEAATGLAASLLEPQDESE